MRPTISVIVPVYNTEKYLDECIQSVLSQSFINFELLLIDDGSTDNSGAICDAYASQDERVRVFHKENSGVSSARNVGLDEAKGEYVIFLDADDYWYRDDCLEVLLRIAVQTKVDVVRGEYKAVDENGNFVFSRSVSKKRMRYANRPINTFEFLKYAVHGEFFLWLCLFRRKIVGNLHFEIGRVFLEDVQFLAKLMIEDFCCMYVPDVQFYAYRKIETSASNSISLTKLGDSFNMCNNFERYALQAKHIKLRCYFQYRSVMMYFWTLETVASDSYATSRIQIINQLQLDDLWRRTFQRIWKYGIWNKSIPFIMLPPIYGICGLRIRNKMKTGIYSIWRKIVPQK